MKRRKVKIKAKPHQHVRRAVTSEVPQVAHHGEQLTDLSTEEQRIALARRAAAAQGLHDLTQTELEYLKPPPPSLRQEMTDEEAHQRAIGAFRIVAPMAPMIPDMLLDVKNPAQPITRRDWRVTTSVAHLDAQRRELEERLRSGKAVEDPEEIERMLKAGPPG